MLIKTPSECTNEELELFKNLVVYGGQVDPNGLEDRIKNCRLLAFYYSDANELIGVSAVKQKNKNSAQNVRRKAGVSDTKIPIIELGYSVTKVEHRGKGINRQLNDELLDKVKGEKIYATTDNDTMRKYLQEKGFNKKGNSFAGSFNENLDYFEK